MDASDILTWLSAEPILLAGWIRCGMGEGLAPAAR